MAAHLGGTGHTCWGVTGACTYRLFSLSSSRLSATITFGFLQGEPEARVIPYGFRAESPVGPSARK